ERVLCSRTALGARAATIHLKSDSTTEITGTLWVAMAQLVADQFTRVNNDITTLKTAIGGGFTAVGAAMAANGALGKTAFDSASSAIPSAVGDVASTKLKSQ